MVELYIIVKSETYFVMLDEPFTHLNPVQIEKATNLLNAEKKNKGMLITDHMYREVLHICDNLYILTEGKTHLTKSAAAIEALGYAKF